MSTTEMFSTASKNWLHSSPREAAIIQATIYENPWIPNQIKDGIFPKQAQFLSFMGREALYGGAAGGGKSVAILAAALQFVQVPNYHSCIIRRTFKQLTASDSILAKSKEWLMNTPAKWSESNYIWTFPNGNTLQFRHMENENSIYDYQGGIWSFIGVDEATQFTEMMIAYPRTRQRKKLDSKLPLRWRGSSNPGGIGHEHIKYRYVKDRDGNHITPTDKRQFVFATIQDNPHIDQADYVETLMESGVDSVTIAQLLHGDWDAQFTGAIKPEWFQVVQYKPSSCNRVRYWDKAGTADDGAYTAGVLISRDNLGYYTIEDVVRGQWSAGKRENMILNTAQQDRQRCGHVVTWVEQEPGSGGKESAENTTRMLSEFEVHVDKVTGDKVTRARPFIGQAENGNVRLFQAEWNIPYLDECRTFPKGKYKDQVDATAGALNKLAEMGIPSQGIHVPDSGNVLNGLDTSAW